MTTSPAGEPAPREHIPYEVLAIEPTTDLAPGNRFEDYIIVHFRGPGNYVDQVKIEKSKYTAPVVDQAIQGMLDHHEDVMNLGPNPHPENLA